MEIEDIVLDVKECCQGFLERFSDDFHDRSPDRMYNILIGDSLKEQILSRLIMQKTEEYRACRCLHEMNG